jgi:copper(I)-binding protein
MRSWILAVLGSLLPTLVAPFAAAAAGPTVEQAWARATPPGVDVGAVYLTIVGGPAADRLTSATTARASMVHLHTIEESGGVAKMRAVEGIEVPAGKRVVLAPKGTHIMLMGLGRPLVAGERFSLTVRFEKSGEHTVDVVVQPAGADGPPASATAH